MNRSKCTQSVNHCRPPVIINCHRPRRFYYTVKFTQPKMVFLLEKWIILIKKLQKCYIINNHVKHLKRMGDGGGGCGVRDRRGQSPVPAIECATVFMTS